MRIHEPAHRVSAAAGLAAGGVLVGHSLTYAVRAPDLVTRDRLLAATGHAYLPAANVMAWFFVLLTLGLLFLGQLTRPWSTPDWKSLTARIAVLQIGAFLSMEVLERMISGAPLAGLIHGGLLPVGVGAQLVVAGGVAVLIRLLLRASDRIAAALGRAPRVPAPRASVLRARPSTSPPQSDLLLAFGRGPPASR